MDETHGLSSRDPLTEIDRNLENSRLRCQKIVLSRQRLRKHYRRQSERFAGFFASFQKPHMHKNISKTTLSDAMHRCGNALAATHFSGDDNFSLILSLYRKQA